MKILKGIFIVLGVIIALLLIFSSTQPNKIEVKESIIINVPSSIIFNELGDFKRWDNWSVWKQKDSNMTFEYSENMGEIGAFSKWKSTVLGNGQQEIIELKENEYIKTEMEFEGWDGKNYAAFNLEKVESGTKVIWNFEGAETPFYMNLMNTFMKFMLEDSYKKSLKNLKEYIESMPKQGNEGNVSGLGNNPMGIEVIVVNARPIISIRDTTTIADLSKKLTELYTELSIYAATEQIEIIGMPLAIYHQFSPKGVILEAAMPTASIIEGEGRVIGKKLPSGKVVMGIYKGNYSDSGKMHNAIYKYCIGNGVEIGTFYWEVYANDPAEVDPELIETHIFYPIN